MQFNSLTLTLNNFLAAFTGGYGRLTPAINHLLWLLGGIEIVLLGLWWALGGGEQLVAVFKKILFLGFWVWLVQSFPRLAQAFVGSLIEAGLIAGGQPGNVQLLMDPSRIAGRGLDATLLLANKIETLGTFDIADQMVYGWAYIAIMGCYLLMAINVFMAILEYYLFVAVVGILMPFGVLKSTKFIAEKAIGAVVSAGIKLMVLAFLVAVTDPVLSNIHFSNADVPMNEVWAVLLTSGACALLAWNAPRLASGLLSGSPTLGAGEAVGVAGAALAAAAGVANFAFSRKEETAAAAGAGGGVSRGGAGARAEGAPGGGHAIASSTVAADAGPSASPSSTRASHTLVASSSQARTVIPGGETTILDRPGGR